MLQVSLTLEVLKNTPSHILNILNLKLHLDFDNQNLEAKSVQTLNRILLTLIFEQND